MSTSVDDAGGMCLCCSPCAAFSTSKISKIRNCEIEMSDIHTNVIYGVCQCVIGFPHVDWAWLINGGSGLVLLLHQGAGAE